jgi:prolyl-tRNA editing enzyme YbaK/EbsC (Cys-tRNA(Pro) deacylase)
MDKPPASIALDQLGIPHRVFLHDQPVNSFEEAATQRGQRPSQIVRSILFQVRDGEFVLRQIVKRSRVRMATEEEVFEVTGYRIGTVSPFGVQNQARVMIDPSVLSEEEISIGSGVRNMAIIMKSEDVHKALADAEVVSLAEDDSVTSE